MFETKTLLILIPALPLAACLLTAALGPRLFRGASHVPTIAALALSFLCSLLLLGEVYRGGAAVAAPGVGYEQTHTLWRWAAVAEALPAANEAAEAAAARDFIIDVTLRADALTAMMLSMVTGVAALVAVFAAGYMQGDRGYWRFFTYFALFVFSMTMLVSVSNFLLMYVFWEAVGLCSYLLIGFWYEKPEAAAAGKKAFLVNRVGDFGFALGVFLIWITFGTLNFHDTAAAPGVLGQTYLAEPARYAALLGGGVGTAICLLLLVGACGKSAQFPLHVWLPDAMEGPTPVSALIHAATMVTAGVYLVARCAPLYLASPTAQVVVAVIGGGTALLAALIALTQFDLKRILAYSTISQLGYMFLALGAASLAGVTAGMFHLLTHAFFKALLFLGAGSVMHAMGGVIDIRRFGGLRAIMPVTCATFLIGSLALAGVAPLAGFWSKDAVIAAVKDRAYASSGHETAGDAGHAAPAAEEKDAAATVYLVLYYLAYATALLTAFYTFRAFFLTFFGEKHVPGEAGHHAHEAPPMMTVPLLVLAVLAAAAGVVFSLVPALSVTAFLAQAPSLAYGPLHAHGGYHGDHTVVAVVSTLAALVGIGLAAVLYLGGGAAAERVVYVMRCDWVERLVETQWIYRFRQSPAVQAVMEAAGVVGLRWLAAGAGYLLLFAWMALLMPLVLLYLASPYRLSQRKFFLDEIYAILFVWPLRLLARGSYWFDRRLIDGLIDALGGVPPAVGNVLRRLQMGLMPFYALAMVLGLLVLLAAKLIWNYV